MNRVRFPQGLTPIQRIQYLQQIQSERGQSHVYLGILNWHDGRVCLKVGKANDPTKRALGYCTHIPGGLTRMVALKALSEIRAFEAEELLYEILLALPTAEAASGEWIYVQSSDVPAAEAALSSLGSGCFDVAWKAPKPKRKRLINVAERENTDLEQRRRQDQQNEFANIVIKQKRRIFVKPYTGTLRG